MYPFDDQKIEHFPMNQEEILANRARIAELRDQLDDITVNQIKQCKRNLILSIDKALELTSNNKLGYPLARNQGLIIPNYVFGKVLGIIESAINTGQVYSYPQFYFQIGGDFDPTAMRQTLQNFKQQLEATDFPNFLALEQAYQLFETEMKTLWATENQNHPQPEF